MSGLIGEPVSRVEGRAKVTGRLRYTADLPFENLAHAALVPSTIPSGRVLRIEGMRARSAPGVIDVLTHENAPRLSDAPFLRLLQDATIYHAGQPVALILADTRQHARSAAALVEVTYEQIAAVTRMEDALDKAYTPKAVIFSPPDTRRGDANAALDAAELRVEQRYRTPPHNHNAIEPHAVIAAWQGDRVVVHTTTQAVFLTRNAIAQGLGIPAENVRVITKYVGGGFGSKTSAWWPCMLLVTVAAKRLGRPVKLELTREQMFTLVGRRQETFQDVKLGATRDGRLIAIRHDTIAQTSMFGEYADPNGFAARVLYACPNVAVTHRLVRVNAPQPVPMRAPGESTGTFALESAIDELAYELEIDPLELRLRNFADHDQHTRRPWSSNGLRQCYRIGAEAFGWERRPPACGMLREGRQLLGWGMASAYYPTHRRPSAATLRFSADGTVLVRCGTQDIGTGTYTIIAQIAAAALAVPIDHVMVEIGDTDLPEGPPSVGSMSAASYTPAIETAAKALRRKLIDLAVSDPQSRLHDRTTDKLEHKGEWIIADDGAVAERVLDLVARTPERMLEAIARIVPADEAQHYSANAYGACFVEARVDPDLGEIRISRISAAYAAGRILNAKTARSQYIGGLVFGIGMALHERTVMDAGLGRIVNGNLADYLVPVHADIPEIDIHLIEEDDANLGTGGVKGIGMVGAVGIAAAIANAVFHATGKRVRSLPITLEQIL